MPYMTSSTQFLPARHRVVTAAVSLIALLLLAAYVAFPAPEVSLASKYTATGSGVAPRVTGEVTDGAGGAGSSR